MAAIDLIDDLHRQVDQLESAAVREEARMTIECFRAVVLGLSEVRQSVDALRDELIVGVTRM